MNTVGVLVVSLSSYDPDADINGVTWPKSHVTSNFDCLALIECNDAIILIMPVLVSVEFCDQRVMLHFISIILT